tara:strand:+ start:170 stop:664 length:495 start_codon:yes stop_codon:yes gene_type:complete
MKDIKGYEGLYSISEKGQVFSRRCWRGIKNRQLTQSLNSYGYVRVFLTKDSKTKGITLHKLMTTTFLGVRPEGEQVRHLDGNKLNNNINNLKYGTALENAEDRRIHGKTAKGELIGSSKLSKKEVEDIRSRYNKRGDMVKLADEYKVSCANIYMIINNKSRKNG